MSARRGQNVTLAVVAVADHQPPTVLVDLTGVSVDIGGHLDLGLQYRHKHLPGTVADDLIQQRPTRSSVVLIGGFRAANYGERGRTSPTTARTADAVAGLQVNDITRDNMRAAFAAYAGTRLLADAELEKDALREVALENSRPGCQAPRRGHARHNDEAVETIGVQSSGLPRSTYARTPIAQTPADPDADLRATLRTYAREHPLHGFRRAWAHLRHDQGVLVNKKKVYRLWKEEGLQVRIHHPRKRAGISTMPQIEADAPKVVWAPDFQFDSTVDGKAIKIASMIDEHTRLS